jgi:hypothetical protein
MIGQMPDLKKGDIASRQLYSLLVIVDVDRTIFAREWVMIEVLVRNL